MQYDCVTMCKHMYLLLDYGLDRACTAAKSYQEAEKGLLVSTTLFIGRCWDNVVVEKLAVYIISYIALCLFTCDCLRLDTVAS